MKLYSFDDHPEHKKQLQGWAERWIANALSTAPMTDADRDTCRDAVKRMYCAANITPPPDDRIVFVSSPFVLRVAGGFAAWSWYCARAATDAATRAATYDATRAATEAAAIIDGNNFWHFPVNVSQLARHRGLGYGGIECTKKAYLLWQGGNQWSSWSAYITFFRYVAKLDIDYTDWDAWEILSQRSGPRIVHEKFCMISDRPEVLLIDDQNRPHCETGPFCRWRDGSAIYAWHGTFVPARWIEHRDELTAQEVLAHTDVEVRAAGCQIVGWAKMLKKLKAKVIDDSGSAEIGKLISVKLPGLKKRGLFLQAECPRNGTILEGVPDIDDFGLSIETARHAQAWRVGMHPSEYKAPEVRT